jgi:transmembrane sensor
MQGSIAWVHGLLHFEQADLPSVLRQLARWYDVEVVYSGKISTGKIQGDLERNIPLSEVLQNLEQMAKVHLKIEGRKIIVNP